MPLTRNQIEHVRASGALVGSVDEILALSPADMEWIRLREALSGLLKAARDSSGLSQAEFARAIEASQSAVSRAEHADPSVSTDWLLRSLIAAGKTRRDIAEALGD